MSNPSLNLEDLIQQIKDLNGKPVNKFAVAATIESLGIRDVDVKEDYGYSSILDLAIYIFELLDSPAYANLKNSKQKQLEQDHKDRLKELQKERKRFWMEMLKVLGLLMTLTAFAVWLLQYY